MALRFSTSCKELLLDFGAGFTHVRWRAETNEKRKRQHLRNHARKSERILWQHLSRRQMLGLKFRRQYGVDHYVIDFYCPALKLAIEVDGESHFFGNAPEYDRIRQLHIEGFGIRFLRVTNVDIARNLDTVLEENALTTQELKRRAYVCSFFHRR